MMDRATVVYDADCGFCRWSAERLRTWDRRHSLRFVSLQTPEADRLLASVPPHRRPLSWHLVDRDGRVWSAGAAVPPLLGHLPGGRPLAALAGSMPAVTDTVYAAVARRRMTLGRLLGRQACSVDPSRGADPRPDDGGSRGGGPARRPA
jgi:predicted DCC family thiol-disulfide oxidoreductase YuxK